MPKHVLTDIDRLVLTGRIAQLLRETEKAHGEYERIQLGGKRDEDWAEWYAGHMVEQMFGPKLEYV